MMENSDKISQLHEEFMDECRYARGLREETLRGYKHSFELLIRIMPTLTLEMILPKTITEFFRRLDTRERKVGKGGIIKIGIKKSTIATYRSKLNKFFIWLKNKGYIEKNPFDEMEYPSVNYDDRKYLKKEQIEKIFTALVMNTWINQLVRKRNLAIFSVFLYCGVRRSELLGIKVIDVDFKRRTLRIRRETSKSQRERIIPLNSKVYMALQDYMDERKKLGSMEYSLFISANGKNGLTHSGLKHLVENMKKISGVKFHVHQLRHTFAVNLLNKGCDIAKVKQLMGHTDIRMTMAYLRCLPSKAMRADVELLDLDNLI